MTEPEGPAPTNKTSQAIDKTCSERLEKLLFAISDFANAIEAATVSLRQNLKDLAEFPEKKPAEVYDQLPWEDRQGNKGPFQMTTKRATQNSDLYRHLFNIVKVNTVDAGKFSYSIGAYYYWVSVENDIIFRRKKKAAKEAKK